MSYIVISLIVVAVSSLSAISAYVIASKNTKNSDTNSLDSSHKSTGNSVIEEKAKARAREILVEAKEEALKIQSKAKDEARKLKEETLELETRVEISKNKLQSKEKEVEAKLVSVKTTQEALEKKEQTLDELLKAQKKELEKIASLTREEARKDLLAAFDKELVEEKGKRLKQLEEDIKKNADVKAKEILVEAMKYGATDYVVEYTTSKVVLPDEEMKGRIIGKEGRNIKTFEEKAGVEVDLDSSAGIAILSSFDPIRREIAKISLERLLVDGRIQPTKIEEIIEKTQKEMEHIIYKAGDDLCHKLGVYNLSKDIVQTLGRFKYRFSYGQNMIEHTLEVTRMGMALASELKLNIETVKLGCLLHDIGKVLEGEGGHVQLGVDLLKKQGIDSKIIDCVAEHHEDRPFSSIESAVVALADHISGARPGSRSEDYSSYIKRLKELEEAATSFDGVERAYAISAGRELRVYVKPEYVDDASCALLSREIAKKIELEQTYPGTVKVSVIRETRFVGTAK